MTHQGIFERPDGIVFGLYADVPPTPETLATLNELIDKVIEAYKAGKLPKPRRLRTAAGQADLLRLPQR